MYAVRSYVREAWFQGFKVKRHRGLCALPD